MLFVWVLFYFRALLGRRERLPAMSVFSKDREDPRAGLGLGEGEPGTTDGLGFAPR